MRSRRRRTSRSSARGTCAGVLAPESANNAQDGGHLIPTLLFGIPAGASMALLLSGFILIGLKPGLEMVTNNLSLTYTIIWSLALANVIGAGTCVLISQPICQAHDGAVHGHRAVHVRHHLFCRGPVDAKLVRPHRGDGHRRARCLSEALRVATAGLHDRLRAVDAAGKRHLPRGSDLPVVVPDAAGGTHSARSSS